MNKLLLASLAVSAITALAVPHNQISRTLDVNTDLISAEVGDGLALTNGVLSADITIEVPTRISELTNDVGFVTETVTNGVSARVTAVSNAIPTATSQITNDSGYLVPSDLKTVLGQDITGSGDIKAVTSRDGYSSIDYAVKDLTDAGLQLTAPDPIDPDHSLGYEVYRQILTSGELLSTNWAGGVWYKYGENDNVVRYPSKPQSVGEGAVYTVAITDDIPTNNTQLINGAGYITSADLPEVPTKTSDLVNDSGYVTESVTNALSARVTAVAQSIPTKVSQLSNDSGYVTTNGIRSVFGQSLVGSGDISGVSYIYPEDGTEHRLKIEADPYNDTVQIHLAIGGDDPSDEMYIGTLGTYITTNWALGVAYGYLDNGTVVMLPTEPRTAENATYTLAITDDIPTNNTQLINGAGYITSADLPEVPTKTSDLVNDSGYVTESVTNAISARVTAVVDAIPTKVSQLTNDSKYVTKTITNNLATTVRSLDARVTAVSNAIPTAVSQLANDAGFVTEAITNGVNTRITAVAQSIPTNNAQLVNGAGYITDHAESSDGQAWIDYNVRTSGSDIGIEMQAVGSDYMLGWRSITSSGEYMTTNWANGLWYRYGENGNKVMYPAKPKTTGFAQSYYLALTDDIPTNNTQLINGAGYITSSDIPEVPTKVSELTNDKYYVTKSVTNTLSVNVRNLETRVTAVSNAIPTAVGDLVNDSGYVTESVTNALSTRLSGVSMAGDWVRFTDSTDYPRFIGAPNYAQTGEGVSIYAGRGGTPTEYPLYTYTQLSNLIVAIASQIVPTSDYDTLEYISTDGSAWANIGRPIYGGRWEMDIMPTLGATYQCVIGCADVTYNNRYYPAFLNSNGKWACGYGYSYNSQTDYSANTRYSISSYLLSTTPIFKVDNVQATMTRSDGSAPTSIPADMYVGARNVAGSSVDLPFKGRIYAIKCYDGNTPILNLEPARQRSTGKVGLHDLIGGGFFPSITATAFSAPN